MKNNMSSILGPEVEISGDVKVTGDLLIYGKVYGNIVSKGAVNSAKGSLIKGDINAENASISGTVEGNLDIQSKVVLGSNSYLTGNLKAAIITIEEGAKFEGMCSMIKKQTATIKNETISNTSSSLKAANEQV
jgi:cytoskeletal protein CcmA (bactofilin family)